MMLFDFPRYVGFPEQFYVKDREHFFRLFQEYNGKKPVFLSVYKFVTKTKLIPDRIIFDLDSKENLKFSYIEAKRLSDFFDRKIIIIFSGCKGFHVYIPVKSSSKFAPRLLFLLQQHIKRKLDLRTADSHLFGDMRRLIRYPTSKYVSKYGSNGRYCRYISMDDFYKGLDHILSLSYTPGQEPQIDYYWTLEDIVEEKLKISFDILNCNSSKNRNTWTIRSSAKIQKDVIVHKCLQRIFLDNPPHIIRFETTAWLKFLGYSDKNIYQFYESLNWIDFSESKTRYQISRVFPRLPDCNKLSDLFIQDCYNCKFKLVKNLDRNE